MDFEKYLTERRKLINDFLVKRMSVPGISKVDEAMKYSLLAGGKRLRPLLVMASADVVGADGTKFLSVGCGLEMIHTYSLIHDDLPVMDNDDYRRGRLTNHKVYGDALALLAGDGLLTLAFEVMLEQQGVDPAVLVKVVREMALCAGNRGMVGGQTLDLAAEGKKISGEEMKTLHEAKTGALFIAAICGGAQLGGASEEQLKTLRRFAELFGLAFQITDDILDVTGNAQEMGKPTGSDEKLDKSTYVSLYSLEKAQQIAADTLAEAMQTLAGFGDKAEPLRLMTKQLYGRKN